MDVTVHIAPAVAQELRQSRINSDSAQELLSTLKKLGVELTPVHPNSPDPALASTFTVKTRNTAHAERVAAQLRPCKATESVYIKPRPAMP